MTFFDKACILVAFVGIPLIWYTTPTPQAVNVDQRQNTTDTWQKQVPSQKEDLAQIKNQLLLAPFLGYAPSSPEHEKNVEMSKVTGPSLFYGTIQSAVGRGALLEVGNTIQIFHQGDRMSDGSIVASITANTIQFQLPDGSEKMMHLYQESL